MARTQSLSIRRVVLLSALRLSMIWDLISTLIGAVLILNANHVIGYSIALIGTLIVVAFNFTTRDIWSRQTRHSGLGMQLVLLKIVWVMAILVDIWTSLTCNAWFIIANPPTDSLDLRVLLSNLSPGQALIVLFVTLITAVSPMLVGHLRDQDVEFLR